MDPMSSVRDRAPDGIAWVPVPLATMSQVVEQLGPVDGEHARSLRLSVRVPVARALRIAIRRRQLGGITALLTTASELRVEPGIAPTAGTLYVGFVLSGAITLIPQDGPTVVLGAGDVWAVCDWSRVEIQCADTTRALHLILPESRMLARGVRPTARLMVLDGFRSLRTPLRNFALSVADPGWVPTVVGELVAERTLEDLLVGLFLEHQLVSDTGRPEGRVALRARALAETGRSHTNTALNPALLAERLSVSLRHLQRAFEGSGTTVAQAISAARLRTATMLLAATDTSRYTMAEIAHRSGFASTFELRSAFRTEFGMLPSDYRAGPVKAAPEEG